MAEHGFSDSDSPFPSTPCFKRDGAKVEGRAWAGLLSFDCKGYRDSARFLYRHHLNRPLFSAAMQSKQGTEEVTSLFLIVLLLFKELHMLGPLCSDIKQVLCNVKPFLLRKRQEMSELVYS